MKKTYKITAKTNGWIASRDSMFNGKTEVTLYSGLELNEAYKILLDMFNECQETNCRNWGQAVLATKNSIFRAVHTYSDGTRMFDYDSRTFGIEIED